MAIYEGKMALLIQLAMGSGRTTRYLKVLKILLTRGGVPKDPVRRCHAQEEEGGWLQRCPLSYDQARCIHPPFVECYAVQAFSIASNLDPKLMPKEQDQIPMINVCTLIQSFVSRHPNNHSVYNQDREKHHTLLTLIRRYNIVYDVTNVEQHELLGTDTSCPLLDVTSERPYPIAVVEGMQSRFFQSTAAAGVVRRVCQARSVSPVAEGQRITRKPPGEREPGVVQEARFDLSTCPSGDLTNLMYRSEYLRNSSLRINALHLTASLEILFNRFLTTNPL